MATIHKGKILLPEWSHLPFVDNGHPDWRIVIRDTTTAMAIKIVMAMNGWSDLEKQQK